jgi:hypothetical protein
MVMKTKRNEGWQFGYAAKIVDNWPNWEQRFTLKTLIKIFHQRVRPHRINRKETRDR